MTPRPFVVSQRLLASALLRPGQLWLSLSPHRRYPGGPRKKALLIAINYSQNRDGLLDTQSEVKKLKALLLKQYGYIESAIVVMSDEDGTDPQLSPTRENILREVGRLLEDQEPDDQYLFYFAGHSLQKPTDDKKEEDGCDELIMPVESYPPDGPMDAEKAIVDDVLKELLVDRLDAKSRLTAIFDTCHSGTLLDLQHYRCNRVYNWISRVRRTGRWGVEVLNDLMSGVVGDSARSGSEQGTQNDEDDGTTFCSGFCPRPKDGKNNVICLSACKDDEAAYDSAQESHSMTAILIDFLDRKPHPTIKQLMRVVSNTKIRGKKSPNPQLSSRLPVRMNSLFEL